MCTDDRQEFILLSDILGISMLVDAVNNVAGPGISDSTVLGPFYTGPQRELAQGATILLRAEDRTGDRPLYGTADKIRADVAAYAAAGVDYLVGNLRQAESIDGLEEALDETARALLD